jgi:hypothetical protein
MLSAILFTFINIYGGVRASHIDQGRRSRFPARVLLRPDENQSERVPRAFLLDHSAFIFTFSTDYKK